MAKTRVAKGTKRKLSCLIIGSGPSLDKLDPKVALATFDEIIVTNSYYKYRYSQVLVPTYYCLSDPNFFTTTNKVTFHDNTELINYLETYNPTLLVSHFYRKHEIVEKFNTLFYDDRELPNFLGGGISPLKPRNYISMTAYKAISMALHFGYKEIFLIGIDNTDFQSYTSDINNHVSRVSTEYFAKTMQYPEMPAYSNPEQFPHGMAGQLQMLAFFFGDLWKFKTENIYNLDKNSLVDAFKKISQHPAIRDDEERIEFFSNQ